MTQISPSFFKMVIVALIQLFCVVYPCSAEVIPSDEAIVSTISERPEFRFLESRHESGNGYSFSESLKYDVLTNTVSKLKNDQFPEVWIPDGDLRGFTMETLSGKSFSAFQNIPFAQPPVGPLRFQPPVKNSRWAGVRDAIAPSPTCLQVDFIQQYNISGTEDCLYLNVYTPQIPKANQDLNLPVMVFIHGGGFFFGSSNLYGPTYLMEEDVVIVSMNYRLGAFGFLSTGDSGAYGNMGLKDQTMALKWVQENIQYFGGDPNRVTIFGESAGAGSVQLHMTSQLSKGLFHAGISESGCTFCFWSISERAKALGQEFAKSFNCHSENSTEMVECLRNVDGPLIALGQLKFLEWIMYPVVVFGPVIEPKHDGAFLDDLPENIYNRGEAASVPWISGFNAEEGALNIASLFLHPTAFPEMNEKWDEIGPVFLELKDSTNEPERVARSIREFYLGNKNISYATRQDTIKMFSDRYVIVCGAKAIDYHSRLSGQPVYAYQLNYRGSYGMVQLIGQSTKDWGVAHLDDLIYLMNNTAYYPMLKKTDQEYQLSRLMVNLWTNFARTGTPYLTAEDGSKNNIWKPVTANSETEIDYLAINLDPKMMADPYSQRIKFWKSLNLTEGENARPIKAL